MTPPRARDADPAGSPSAGRGQELARFRALQSRAICGFGASPGWGSVVVTGGTGCIGTALLRVLARAGIRQLVSVARRPVTPDRRVEGVTYRCADVRDAGRIRQIVGDVAPDVVFHLAAQRDPGLAEQLVHETISTNVVGALTVLAEAGGVGVPTVVQASTGKALRFFTSDVYAATKMLAEYGAARASARWGTHTTSVRFTHVIDNSIVYSRLQQLTNRGLPLKLHGADVHFYVQSAIECAQLLITAAALAPDQTQTLALHDLGWPPISLMDLALDIVARAHSRSPVVVVGFEPGYEETYYPALYDPRTAGEVSPLFNALEAGLSRGVCGSPSEIDTVVSAETSPVVDVALEQLQRTLRTSGDAGSARAALALGAHALLRSRLDRFAPGAVARLADRARDIVPAGHDHWVVQEELAAWRARRDHARVPTPRPRRSAREPSSSLADLQ